MDAIKLKLIEYGFSFVIAPLAVIFVQLFKRYSFWLESLGAWPKRAFVAVTVTVFLAIGQATGVDFGIVQGQENVDFLSSIDTNTVKVLLGSAFAFLLHAVKKAIKK